MTAAPLLLATTPATDATNISVWKHCRPFTKLDALQYKQQMHQIQTK